jgi:hypothetical protein
MTEPNFYPDPITRGKYTGGYRSPPGSDFLPSWADTRSEQLWLAFDIVTIMVPGGAMISGLSKAKWLRRFYKAERASDKTKAFGVASAEVMTAMPIRSGLLLSGVAVNTPVGPFYWHRRVAQVYADATIMYYRDREGRIRSYLPSDFQIEQSTRTGDSLTSKPGVQPKRFTSGSGLASLSSVKGGGQPEKFSIARGTRTRRKSPRPVAARGRSRPRRDRFREPFIKNNKITPPSVVRARFRRKYV